MSKWIVRCVALDVAFIALLYLCGATFGQVVAALLWSEFAHLLGYLKGSS